MVVHARKRSMSAWSHGSWVLTHDMFRSVHCNQGQRSRKHNQISQFPQSRYLPNVLSSTLTSSLPTSVLLKLFMVLLWPDEASPNFIKFPWDPFWGAMAVMRYVADAVIPDFTRATMPVLFRCFPDLPTRHSTSNLVDKGLDVNLV